MWKMVAAMLHLGSLDFGAGDHAAISDDGVVANVEGLLGVTGLKELLLKRAIKIGSETTLVEHSPPQAQAARDACVKIMYVARNTSVLLTPRCAD